MGRFTTRYIKAMHEATLSAWMGYVDTVPGKATTYMVKLAPSVAKVRYELCACLQSEPSVYDDTAPGWFCACGGLIVEQDSSEGTK